MSLIHDKLHYHSSLGGVMFKEYVEDLVKIIFDTYNVEKGHVKLDMSVENVFADINLIASIGLIINEIVTNSFKYAFPEERKGTIYIHIKKLTERKFEMIIGDDGIGFPEGLNIKDSNTLGLQVVQSLVSQHNGSFEMCSKKGTEIKFVFEEEEE